MGKDCETREYFVTSQEETKVIKTQSNMPEISRFYGIIIRMFYNDHNPPHFHAEYGDYKCVINLEDEVVNGFMPKRALKLIFEWLDLHKLELLDNWKRCVNNKKPHKIPPLK